MPKIVVISDTHGAHEQISLPNGDILIHAGDYSTYGNLQDTLTFCNWWNSITKYKYKILVPGNHDEFTEKAEFIVKGYLDNQTCLLVHDAIEIMGIKFFGSPYTPMYNNWSFMLPRKSAELKRKWDLIPEDTEVLITHGPPYGVLDTNLQGQHCGCELLLKRIKNLPKLTTHVFGHLHRDELNFSKVTNIGKVACYNASIVNDSGPRLNSPLIVDI